MAWSDVEEDRYKRSRRRHRRKIALPGWDIDIHTTSDDDMSDFPLKKILSSIPDPGPQGLRHRLEVDTYWNAKDGPYLNIGNRQSNDDGLALTIYPGYFSYLQGIQIHGKQLHYLSDFGLWNS